MMSRKSAYCVTRQRQWPDGDLCVELSSGSFDYINPGMLGSKGLIGEYSLALEAAEAAIADALEWQKEESEPVHIGWGYTGGWTMPFDLNPLDEDTFTELREWAQKRDDKLDRCAYCGNPITSDEWHFNDYSDKDTKFCSEHCADKDYQEQWKANHEDEEDDDDD